MTVYLLGTEHSHKQQLSYNRIEHNFGHGIDCAVLLLSTAQSIKAVEFNYIISTHVLVLGLILLYNNNKCLIKLNLHYLPFFACFRYCTIFSWRFNGS